MAPADTGDEEIALMTENYEEKRKCQGSWKLALALTVGTLAVAGLACFTFHNPTQTLAEKEPAFIEEAPQGFDVSGHNTNSGNQAGRDIHNGDTICNHCIMKGESSAPQESECHVKSETKSKVQFRDDGTFIMYRMDFEGKFYVNYKPVTNVKDLPRCLTKLWLSDDDLGGRLSDLPRALTNLSLPGGPFQRSQFTGDLQDLPPMLQYLDLSGTSERITGHLRDLPRGLVHLDLWLATKITGYMFWLPKGLHYVNLDHAKIQGGTWDLPLNLTHAHFGKNTKMWGDLSSLPKGLTWKGCCKDTKS